MTETIFHLIFVITFLAFIAIRMYYHRRARQTEGKVEFKEGRRSIILRLGFGIPYILSVLVYMIYPAYLAWAAFELPAWARLLGAAMTIIALPLILWVQWALGSNFHTRLHVREEHTLVRHGPYRWVRHPMYTTFLIQATGILLLTANAWVGGIYLAALLVVIAARWNTEEAAMLDKFGDAYSEYMQETGKLLPRIGGRRAGNEGGKLGVQSQ